MDVETHQAVFQWVLQVLAERNLLKGNTIGVDATTLEANAALRSIIRRHRGTVQRVSRASGERERDPNADPGATGQVAPEAEEEGVERRMAASARPGCPHHQN